MKSRFTGEEWGNISHKDHKGPRRKSIKGLYKYLLGGFMICATCTTITTWNENYFIVCWNSTGDSIFNY